MRCRAVGCTELVNGQYCAKHQHTNERSTKVTDPVYLTTAWRKFSKFIRVRNPICQRIVNGAQCMRPATLVHHLVSPRLLPTGLLDPANVCALCAGCHPPDEGTPHWKPGTDFTPTVS